MTNFRKRLTVCVVGGGIGGAATAACIASQGAQVSLMERAPQLREVGAGIFLKLNSLRVLRQLGIHQEMARQGTWIRESQLWGRDANALLKRAIGPDAVLTVRREDIHQALVQRATNEGVEITTHAEVESVDHGGIVTLKGGQQREFDLVIGADGVGSVVRESISMTRNVSPTGAGSWRALVQRRQTDPQDKVIEFWRGRRRILVVPAGPGRTYLCASSRDDDAVLSSNRFNREAWADVFPEFGELIQRVDPEGMVRRQHIKVAVHGWFKGRVAILGDAVHGQPPNLGQGAGCAIANGAALAEGLAATDDLAETLRTWEKKQRLLTEEVQSWSNLYDSVVHGWPTQLEFGRKALVRGIVMFAPTRNHWSRLSAGLPAGAH